MPSSKRILLIAEIQAPISSLEHISEVSIRFSILTRKDSTSTFPNDIPIFRADYSNQTELETAMRGHQIVICMVAVFATGGQQILVDVAIAAGVEILILSEFGPPSRDPKFAALQPALPPKVATNDILEVLEGINDGEEWIVRHVTSEEIIEQGRKRLADGDTMGAIDLVGGEALEREALGDSRPWGIWNEKLGIPRGDL
ncbi:hypothetical protein CKM354_000781800 [Cercospora kikuchii]|uniref:NmrA-like domain-containing protein n=1 Tax=Cercospora kikuchii TaxID=84275 RepID=A0A9P3FEP6_9PEZI|nr:uncharacterized protein CKM354_000781800 [Cercospora kikuchii]GIZ44626.1 hypothetical protein CKM354_000781800 [Cercospora kikuchii]